MKQRTDLFIEVPKGVSPPGFDTYLITEHVVRHRGRTLLDMGSGSGYIAIHAAKNGKDCVASDIHQLACMTTKENALKNSVSVEVVQSDLFEHIAGKFDLISFNPPYGSSSSSPGSAMLEFIKSLVPRNNVLIAEAAFLVVQRDRKRFIQTFLDQVSHYLNTSGDVLLLLHYREVKDILDRYKGSVVGESRWMRLVLIPATSF